MKSARFIKEAIPFTRGIVAGMERGEIQGTIWD